MKSMPASASVRTCAAVCFRAHPDARFDDGADERPPVHAREPARSRDAKLRALIAIEKCGRQSDVEQLEARKRFQLEEIAGDRGQKVGQRGPVFSSGQESVTSAVRRTLSVEFFGVPEPGKEGRSAVPNSVICSTRAAKRSRNSSVSPGTRMKVPVDCSPAMIAAASSSGKAVSIQ